MNMRKIMGSLSGALAFATLVGAGPAVSGTTLSAANCFPKGTYFARPFEDLIADINKQSKGDLTLNYRGGAPAIGSPFTLVQKTSKGVFDSASCTGSYYQNVLPEVDAFKMLERSLEEVRANGAVDFMNRLHEAKGLHYIGRVMSYTPFHLYLNKPISKPDLKGLHLRVAPIYTAFFQALGATTQRSNIAQVYTYMENGTVHGYGWPITGILPDWHKVTKYRVDPGFYNADLEIMVNLKKWQTLGRAQQELMTRIVIEHEKAATKFAKDVEKAVVVQAKNGIKTIEFTGADRTKWLAAAREAGWANIIKRSPENGPKLRALFAK